MHRFTSIALLAIASAVALQDCEAAQVQTAPTAPGYRGIWYMNQPTGDEFKFKYSGGLGTYPQQHTPIAIYSAAANKTFFCYGGTTGKPNELACMVSCFDHATGKVPRPRIVLVKQTDDAHENPTVQLDDAGHVWVFCATHGPAPTSHIFRSVKAFAIDEFVEWRRPTRRGDNFSYSQPWFVPGRGLLFLHTKYENGRRFLHWMASDYSQRRLASGQLATVAQGHYQISHRRGQRVATAFNYHPEKGGLNARTNLYYLETETMGAHWRTAAGELISTPITTIKNAALVHDYESEGKLVYLKDLNFDADGHPVILYLTSRGYAPGPKAGKREWLTAQWMGRDWRIRPFTTSDHNYDYGSLYVENGEWRIIAPTEPGPQPWSTGGEMVLWTSRDEGATWNKLKQLTTGSRFNHTYARRPLNAHPQFYALWADGNPLQPSESRLYFTDREGSHVWQLPYTMSQDEAEPEVVPAPR
jgi:hypothetical protein